MESFNSRGVRDEARMEADTPPLLSPRTRHGAVQAHSPQVSDNFSERYTALIELGHVLTGILRPADLYHALAARLDRGLDLDSLIVSRVDDGGETATIVHDSAADGAVRGPTYGTGDCVAIRDRRPVLHLPGDPPAACRANGNDARGRPAISAPVVRGGRVVGVLTAIGRTGTVYDTSDLEFLATAAGLVSPSMSGPSADGHPDQLDTLGRIIGAIAVPNGVNPLESAVQATLEATGADGVALWLVRSGGDMEAVHAAGPLAPKRGEKLALSHDLFRELAGQHAPMPFDNRSDDNGVSDDFRRLTRGTAGFVAPLHAQDRVLGALVVCFKDQDPGLPASALGGLERMATIAAVAAGYARLNDQIGALSLIDPLTGIPNRRQLAMYLDKEFAAARRGRRLTLLLFDIDDFAQYNRSNGKQAGDEILRAFAETLVQQTRAMNLAARFEDDAFIVALADADRRAGFIHASRIARAAEAHALIGPSGIHASVGISSYAPRMKSFEDMIRAAEKDLEVRRSGGGRLTI